MAYLVYSHSYCIFFTISKRWHLVAFTYCWRYLGYIDSIFFSIKFGVGGFRKIDILSLGGAGFSLVLWYLTNEPAVALFFIILTDLIGVNLTITKTWKNPETENWVGWAMCGVGGLLGTLAVGKFDFVLISFPPYVCLINSAMAIIILARRKNNFSF